MKRTLVFLLCILMLLCGIASAEYVQVKTPKGPLKMRKEPKGKSKLVCEIPNKTLLIADEVGEEWCHVTYQGKEGYVKTEYLKLFSDEEDNGIRVTLSTDSPVTGEEFLITVRADGAVLYRYELIRDGKTVCKGTETDRDETWYRPRDPGTYILQVTADDGQGNALQAQKIFQVQHGEEVPPETSVAENDEEVITVYSQKDGWWKDKKYRSSNLEASGCAIFTLSHGLQLLGLDGEGTDPQSLAKDFAYCLVDGGTLNSTLIGGAAKKFGFSTQPDLIENKSSIIRHFEDGAVFTFAIVKGHIALAAGISEDRTMIRIVDSAPAVTLERIKNSRLYIQDEDGEFQPITSIAEVPGSKYYFETDSYSGAVYYLELDYVAGRGVRLIQPK